MQAALGYQPGILPDLDQRDALYDSPDGFTRHAHRLREIAVQSMVETTARERAQRALRSKTRPAIEVTEWKIGDTVEFFRATGNKEASGWRGPGTIVCIDPDGTVHVKWQGSVLICRMQDVRPTLMYHAMTELFAFTSVIVGSPYNVVMTFLKTMSRGSLYLGYLERNGIFILSDAAQKQCMLPCASCRWPHADFM